MGYVSVSWRVINIINNLQVTLDIFWISYDFLVLFILWIHNGFTSR